MSTWVARFGETVTPLTRVWNAEQQRGWQCSWQRTNEMCSHHRATCRTTSQHGWFALLSDWHCWAVLCMSWMCTLVISRTRTNFVDRAVSAAGPPVWNYLPSDLRQLDLSECRFRQLLKTYFLRKWDHCAV